MKYDIAQTEIGKRIAESRRDKKLTQEELANRIGITAQALSQYERGLRYPDIAILKALCVTLGVSSDYLMGLKDSKVNEIDDVEIEQEIWSNLRNSLDTLSIVFGEDFISSWSNDIHGKQIPDLRLRLAKEGILMPIVRIRDWDQLKPREFIILAYDNVLYHEEIIEGHPVTVDYTVQKLEEVVRQHYADILSPDIIKDMVENLRINHSAIINGIVPEKISYGQLLVVCRELLGRGDGMVYLPRIIEMIGEIQRKNLTSSDDEIVEIVAKQLESPNNKWVWLNEHKKN